MNTSRNPFPIFLRALLCGGALLFGVVTTLQAGSATWNVNPVSSDWNTAANWTPHTVPNGSPDTAMFSASNNPTPVIQSTVEVDALVFGDSVLTPYTILVGQAGGQQVGSLTLSGTGIVNDSDASTQALQATSTLATNGSTNLIALRNDAALPSSEGGFCFLTALGGASTGLVGGEIQFFDNSMAGAAAVEADKGQNGGGAGQVSFFDNSSAGEAQVVNIAGAGASAPGVTMFYDQATAESAIVTNYGASTAGVEGGTTFFLGSSTAGDSTILADGSIADGAGGGTVIFSDTSSAGNAHLSATAGHENGSFQFRGDSTGGTALLFGTGDLVIADHNPPGVTIGLIEGSGNVFLGSNELTVGTSNNTDFGTTYYGTIQGSGGSLMKIGTGLVTLIGANTYTGSTTINGGALATNNTTGSATGTGPVNLIAGNLGGQGIIAGPVTIGSGMGPGAILEPGVGSSGPRRLTLQNSLTFKADGDYACLFNTKRGRADQVIANGVVIENGAQFAFGVIGNKPLNVGKVFNIISNTSTNPISGTFANLADGSILTEGKNRYLVSYSGGDGNDLTLTVVP